MIIAGEYEHRRIICDSCGYSPDFEAELFVEYLDFMKEEGWQTKYVDGAYENHCPDCVEEEQMDLGNVLGQIPKMEGFFNGKPSGTSKRSGKKPG